MIINAYEMGFDGEVLQRGFWLYIWKIVYEQKTYIYIGRTGDSSSPNASSPFNRIGQHLDFRNNAKGNSLAKNLIKAGVDPKQSKFSMLALGPLFEEQKSFDTHKPFRDQMATLEYETAEYLKKNNFTVLGKHYKGTAVPLNTVAELLEQISRFLK